MNEIENIEYLIWHGVQATCEEKCHCHAECNKADEFIENFKSKYLIKELQGSDQEALANAWEQGHEAGKFKYIIPKNPYTKD